MKKINSLILVGAVVGAISTGSAMAAPTYHGATNTYRPHQVTHVQSNPRAGHHHVHHSAPVPAPVVVHESRHHHHHHHHHHHNDAAGNIILATAILISAFM